MEQQSYLWLLAAIHSKVCPCWASGCWGPATHGQSLSWRTASHGKRRKSGHNWRGDYTLVYYYWLNCVKVHDKYSGNAPLLREMLMQPGLLTHNPFCLGMYRWITSSERFERPVWNCRRPMGADGVGFLMLTMVLFLSMGTPVLLCTTWHFIKNSTYRRKLHINIMKNTCTVAILTNWSALIRGGGWPHSFPITKGVTCILDTDVSTRML